MPSEARSDGGVTYIPAIRRSPSQRIKCDLKKKKKVIFRIYIMPTLMKVKLLFNGSGEDIYCESSMYISCRCREKHAGGKDRCINNNQSNPHSLL